MREIKSKGAVEGTLKAVDKSAVAGQRMKDAYIKTKKTAEHSVYASEGSSEEYASDRFTEGVDTVSREVIHQVDVQGQKLIQGTKKRIEEVKEKRQEQKYHQSQSQPTQEVAQTQQPVTPTVQKNPVPHSYPESVSQRVPPNASGVIREREYTPTKSSASTIKTRDSVDPGGRSKPDATAMGTSATKEDVIRGRQIASAKENIKVKGMAQAVKPPASPVSTPAQSNSDSQFYSAYPATIADRERTIKTVENSVEVIRQSAGPAVEIKQGAIRDVQIKTAIRDIKTRQAQQNIVPTAASQNQKLDITFAANHSLDCKGTGKSEPKAIKTSESGVEQLMQSVGEPKQEAIREKQIANAKVGLKARRAEQASSLRSASVVGAEKTEGKILSGGLPSDRTLPAIRTRELCKPIEGVGKGTVKASEAVAAKAAGRTIKTAKYTVKTVAQTGNAAIKTTEISVQAAQKAAVAAAKNYQRVRAAMKASATAAKAIAAATVKTVKAIIAAMEQLVSSIIAGGSAAVLAVVVILMIGMLVGSSFGIFFSGEEAGEGETIQEVIQQINTEYQEKLDALLVENIHDEVEMSGSHAVWPEVLAVYSVKVTTDQDNPMEAVTMNDEKKMILQDLFWQMNEITFEMETRAEMDLVESMDASGNIVESWQEVEKEYLVLTVEHKTVEEMAEILGFDDDQREQLAQLLDEDFDHLWLSVLYGIDAGDENIVTVAMSQIGNVGGELYWSWYGFTGHVEWCACFVSWCANECGYIDSGIIPKFSGCVNGVNWFKSRGQWMDNGAEPVPGMIIFFDWDDEDGQDGISDHVGIVGRVENGRVYTIEGNSGDRCRERNYALGSSVIMGYGVPAY